MTLVVKEMREELFDLERRLRDFTEDDLKELARDYEEIAKKNKPAYWDGLCVRERGAERISPEPDVSSFLLKDLQALCFRGRTILFLLENVPAIAEDIRTLGLESISASAEKEVFTLDTSVICPEHLSAEEVEQMFLALLRKAYWKNGFTKIEMPK